MNHPDLHVLDGTKEKLGIDTVREFVRKLQYFPYEAPNQVGIILFADALTEEAQNFLLKPLEEHSEKTHYILTASHEKKILETVRSRCKTIFPRN